MKVLRLLLLLTTVLTLSSCRHRDLPDWSPAHTSESLLKVNYNLQWEIAELGGTNWRTSWPEDFPYKYDDLLPSVPNGLRAHMITADHYYFNNLPPDGGILQYECLGQHFIIFHNNDIESIRLTSVDDPAMVFAYTQAPNRQRESEPDSSIMVLQPDNLFASHVPSIEVLHPLEGNTPSLEVTMEPRVFSYLVIADFAAGLEYVREARAVLTGMSQGVWLVSGKRASQPVSYVFSASIYPKGVIGVLRSFGTPSGDPVKHILTVQVALTHGNVVRFDFDVTEQVNQQPRGGVIKVSGLAVTPEQAKVEGEGFEVDVIGWGDPIVNQVGTE